MAVDYFLKLDTVEGESKATGHTKEIQVLSWSWGASNTSTVAGSGGSGAGRTDMSDLNIMMEFDKSVTHLMQGLTKGTHFKTGVLAAVKSGSGNKDYLIMSLEEIFITSLQLSASSEVPTVSMSLTYKKVKLEYKMQDAEGVLTTAGTASYDLTNRETT